MAKRKDRTLTVEYALTYFEDCPEFLDYCFNYCIGEAEHQRKFSMQAAFEMARRKDWVCRDGQRFKGASNNLVAPAARIFVSRYPQFRKYISLRPAACDAVGAIEE